MGLVGIGELGREGGVGRFRVRPPLVESESECEDLHLLGWSELGG